MSDKPNNSASTRPVARTSVAIHASIQDISVDLTWVDMLKGIAIVGVFLDNWTGHMRFATSPALLYHLAVIVSAAVGPFVQVFFILSGFGLTVGYLNRDRANWSWKEWAWRRITKIVVPYEIVVVFSFLLGVLGSHLYTSVNVQFSWASLLAYITFSRNFYAQSWMWNPPLWFMPVIIGLYISFPVLIKILERWGAGVLLLISGLVTYGTLIIAVLVGAPKTHSADVFTFWMVQFALGIVLARIRETAPQKLRHLIGLRPFFLGIGLLLCSWVLRTYVPLGKVFNDSVTSVGMFLALLNLVWTARAKVPVMGKMLNHLSYRSYYMYLIHCPIMMFLIGPPLRVPTNPIVVIALGVVYLVVIFLLCGFISRPIEKLSSWAYRKYAGFEARKD